MLINILSNTGNVALVLYGFFILLTVIGFFVSFNIIKNNKIEKERFDRIVELFKFSMVTVSIATVTSIVAELFKEREYDKNEMTTFNTYIPHIIDTVSTLETKITFCTFFSHVTPRGDLRDGWQSFTKHLTDEKSKKEKNEEKEKEKLLSKVSKDKLEVQDFAEVASQLKETQQIHVNTNTVSDNNSYLVVVGTDPTRKSSEPELEWARKNVSENAEVYPKGKWYITAIPVNTSYSDAKLVAENVKSISNGKRVAYVISSRNIISQ